MPRVLTARYDDGSRSSDAPRRLPGDKRILPKRHAELVNLYKALGGGWDVPSSDQEEGV